jgi:hypothetical protein
VSGQGANSAELPGYRLKHDLGGGACEEPHLSAGRLLVLTCKVVMSILLLLRNYTPAHEQVVRGEWDVAPVARLSFDLENKVIGTIGAGVRSYGQTTCS